MNVINHAKIRVMKRSYIFLLLLSLSSVASAQTFLTKASVEYEVKTNVKKTMGESPWAEMLKDRMPDFKVSYFRFTFSGNKSVYKFDRWQDKNAIPEFMRSGDENASWYFDHDNKRFNMRKNVFGSDFDVDDSIPSIQWRLSNESRVIAGFNCRKAVGKIMDSVYVFVFFTEEIVIPGGPCSINGLPGLVLGMTIPRLYTSWIATSVQVSDIDESVIKPSSAKKYYKGPEMKKVFFDRIKEWGEPEDPESKKWIEQLLWNVFL